MVLDYFIGGTDIDTTSSLTESNSWFNLGIISIVQLIYFIYLFSLGREQPRTTKAPASVVIVILPAYKYKRLTVLIYLRQVTARVLTFVYLLRSLYLR